jgi:hypothetical protein
MPKHIPMQIKPACGSVETKPHREVIVETELCCEWAESGRDYAFA